MEFYKHELPADKGPRRSRASLSSKWMDESREPSRVRLGPPQHVGLGMPVGLGMQLHLVMGPGFIPAGEARSWSRAAWKA